MGELIYPDQRLLQSSLSLELFRLYNAICDNYKRFGASSRFIRALKQLSWSFFRHITQLKHYQNLRTQVLDDVQSKQTPVKCELFEDDKISGCLYALPASNSLLSEQLEGNVNILTIDHGAIQIENPDANSKFRFQSQRLTHGQSSVNLKDGAHDLNFKAKTNIALFLCISCNQDT